MWIRSIERCSRHLSSRGLWWRAGLPRHCHSLDVRYEQGQSPEPRVREYFYYIDHQGMLFLDDARMKTSHLASRKKFLQFFFSRLRMNESDRYPEFPFLSPCGRERNYVRCDDLPFVFTHLVDEPSDVSEQQLAYGNTGATMTHPFLPSELCMQVETGRVYHPAPDRVGGVGLVRSQLAIQLASHFIFEAGEDQPPTHIMWRGKKLELTQNMVDALHNLDSVREYSLGLNGTL